MVKGAKKEGRKDSKAKEGKDERVNYCPWHSLAGVATRCPLSFVQFLEGLFQDMALVKHDLERQNMDLIDQVRELKAQNKVQLCSSWQSW